MSSSNPDPVAAALAWADALQAELAEARKARAEDVALVARLMEKINAARHACERVGLQDVDHMAECILSLRVDYSAVTAERDTERSLRAVADSNAVAARAEVEQAFRWAYDDGAFDRRLDYEGMTGVNVDAAWARYQQERG